MLIFRIIDSAKKIMPNIKTIIAFMNSAEMNNSRMLFIGLGMPKIWEDSGNLTKKSNPETKSAGTKE